MSDLNALTEAEYHRHPALSYSGAKILLQPGGPAKYRHMMSQPPVTKDVYDLGHGVHTVTLGKGSEIVVIDAPDWRTKAAKEAKAAAHADHKVPLLAHQHAEVMAMHGELMAHPIAGPLFRRNGIPEERLSWESPTDTTSVPWRTMIDWRVPGVIVDLKTSNAADPWKFGKSFADFRYHLQAAVTIEAVETLTGETCGFVNVVQEVEPPYLVAVYQPDAEAIDEGRRMMRRASEIFRDCTESGVWPGYPAEVQPLSLPRYYQFTE